MIAYTESTQKLIKEAYSRTQSPDRKSTLQLGETIWEAPDDYKGGHYDHFYNFFQAVRGKGKIIQDPTFGLRAAGAALLANESYFTKKPVDWNPDSMKLV